MLDTDTDGQDARVAATWGQFAGLYYGIRDVERLMGMGNKSKARASQQWAIKCLRARRDIQAGEVVTEDMVCAKRPGVGNIPLDKDIRYMVATRDIKADKAFYEEDLCAPDLQGELRQAEGAAQAH
jgi:sialic acid synthase SpsE